MQCLWYSVDRGGYRHRTVQLYHKLPFWVTEVFRRADISSLLLNCKYEFLACKAYFCNIYKEQNITWYGPKKIKLIIAGLYKLLLKMFKLKKSINDISQLLIDYIRSNLSWITLDLVNQIS